MALRKTQPATEAARPQVALIEGARTVAPEYHPAGLPGRAVELAELAESLGMRVEHDWGDRPCVSEADARVLFLQLMQRRPAPVDPPRPRGHVPGPTMPDPSTERAEVH